MRGGGAGGRGRGGGGRYRASGVNPFYVEDWGECYLQSVNGKVIAVGPDCPPPSAQLGDAASAALVPITSADLNLSNADESTGYAILNQFIAHASQFPNFQLQAPEDILNYYMANWSGPVDPDALLESIGSAATAAGMSSTATDQAMANLAAAGKGMIPQNPNAFFSFLTNQAVVPNSWDEAVFVAQQTASSVSSGLQQVGQTALTVGQTTLSAVNYWKSAIYFVPVIVLWIAYKNKDQIAKAAGKAITGGL